MNRPPISVVIVNWNRWADTAACVDSLLATGYTPLCVIVVDNGSESDDDGQMAARGPTVEVVRSPVNAGFAAGVNLGIARALASGAAYLLLLNNDAIVDTACLDQLVAAAEGRPERGIIGPKVLYRDQPERIWFAGAQRGRWSLSIFGHGRGALDGPPFNIARPVTYLCAGAMLVRRDVFTQVGLFDPGYFMYYEDCEWCLRACAAGYTLWYEPTARVWHTVAASSGGEGSPQEIYFRTVSVIRFLCRNSYGMHRAVLLALRVGLILLRIVGAVSQGHQAEAQALWRGLCDGVMKRSGQARQCESF